MTSTDLTITRVIASYEWETYWIATYLIAFNTLLYTVLKLSKRGMKAQ